MTLPTLNGKSFLVCASGAVAGITLQGVLSMAASIVAIVVGGLHIYDWFKTRRKK